MHHQNTYALQHCIHLWCTAKNAVRAQFVYTIAHSFWKAANAICNFPSQHTKMCVFQNSAPWCEPALANLLCILDLEGTKYLSHIKDSDNGDNWPGNRYSTTNLLPSDHSLSCDQDSALFWYTRRQLQLGNMTAIFWWFCHWRYHWGYTTLHPIATLHHIKILLWHLWCLRVS